MSALLGLLFAVSSTAAQPQQSHPGSSAADTIVVEGRRTKETANEYIDKLLPALGTEAQFGRFEDPLCPKAIGLTDDLAAQVADRVRQVARAANIRVAAGSCTPNLLIIAAADKKAMIETLRKSRPGYLNGVGSDELKRLGNSTRPYVAWQVTDELAADGMPIGGGNNLPSGSNGARGGAPTERNHDTFVQGDFARLKTTVSPSRIRSTVRPRVLSSVVIVEDRALTNSTVRQLADFALIKAMTPTEEREHEPPSSSILSLFNPGVTVESGPQSVTWWDLAFLKSLTNTRSDAFADTQRSEIRDHMLKEISKVPVQQ
jgi:DNA-binding ferritin-like protein (Dps family)